MAQGQGKARRGQYTHSTAELLWAQGYKYKCLLSDHSISTNMISYYKPMERVSMRSVHNGLDFIEAFWQLVSDKGHFNVWPSVS